VVLLSQQRSLDVADRFPGVVALWVPFPLNEVLYLTLLTSMGSDGLNFVLFLTLYQVQGWPRVILTVFFCLDIWGKGRGMEHGVYGPLWGKGQLVCHRRDHLSDLEQPMMSRGQFH